GLKVKKAIFREDRQMKGRAKVESINIKVLNGGRETGWKKTKPELKAKAAGEGRTKAVVKAKTGEEDRKVAEMKTAWDRLEKEGTADLAGPVDGPGDLLIPRTMNLRRF
ncbi:MAG TPA: hypothetical protein PLJ33_03550, partial [Peptococcaceae bacterium]|nr:hypothetical protein [Peptococcaceae bacterium]